MVEPIPRLIVNDVWRDMPDYRLEDLGPTSFEELAQALLIGACGVDLIPMGAGRDGGRDALTNGNVRLRAGDEYVELNGYTVFQAKHHAVLGSHPDNAAWLWGEIKKELDKWTTNADRSRTPHNLIFITNVYLTPYPDSGGRDTIDKHLHDYRAALYQPVRDENPEQRNARKMRQNRLENISTIRVLDRTWINGGLATSDSVRRAFPAFLSAADVFAAISDFTGAVSHTAIAEALLEDARQSLTIDGSVWMAEGGDATGSKVSLHKLVVDLPVLSWDEKRDSEIEPIRSSLVNLVLERAERMLRPRLGVGRSKRHIVITGAAGNGKTTMAKLLVQIFRCAMLRGATLSQGQQDIVDGTTDALQHMGRKLPNHLRWPIRVDLKEMLQHHKLVDGGTMLRAIAEQVSKQLDTGPLTAAHLANWQRAWPWLVVFDGFDEVTDANARRIVIERIEQFIEEAEASDADLMVVLTTRALGYNDEMSEDLFERIDLDYLSTDEGVKYAHRVVQTSLSGDPARQRQVLETIESAAKNPAQRSLLRTPLQILILAIIVNGAQHLEPDRYGLFSRYFDLAFEREKSKGPGLQMVLTNFEPVIRALHREVGFALHSRAESSNSPDPVLSEQELRDLIWRELELQGFKPRNGDERIQQVLDTATRRLVLIAPKDTGYGFEIRSLQELTAGQWLMEEHPDVATKRLRIAAASPHWRNTILFATGYAFHGGNAALQRAIIECIRSVDDDQASRLGSTFPVGPRLALEMVDDGMVRNRPGFSQQLFDIALRVLHTTPDLDFGSVALSLIQIADESSGERRAFADSLRDAISGTPIARHNAGTLRSMASPSNRRTFSLAKQTIIAVTNNVATDSQMNTASSWAEFEERITHASLDRSAKAKLNKAVSSLRRIRDSVPTEHADLQVIQKALESPSVATVLDSALATLAQTNEPLLAALHREVISSVLRRAVGDEIAQTRSM